MARRSLPASRRGWRRATLGLAAVLAVLPVLASCAGRGGPACAPLGTVLLPRGEVLCVEVADTPGSRARGYMFRPEVKRGEGMVFLMESLDVHPFWMKNCLVPLDIIWMDGDWRIVHIAESLPPCRSDPCPSYGPMKRSLYVLEVAAGESAALGLEPGDVLRYVPPEGD